MDAATIQRLNALNRQFYETTADEFDQTRGQSWPGWDRLLPYLDFPQMSVLDAGCGNGRLGLFLAEKLPGTIFYHGIDSSAALLKFAEKSLSQLPTLRPQLEARDLIESPLPDRLYDLVTLFGVMHHVPGAQTRLELMRRLAKCVKPGGILAFACWRFYEYPRFRQRIIPWAEGWQVEEGDFLLDWQRGENAPRYCHYVDDSEHEDLCAASGLQQIARFRSDGAGGEMNLYSILQQR